MTRLFGWLKVIGLFFKLLYRIVFVDKSQGIVVNMVGVNSREEGLVFDAEIIKGIKRAGRILRGKALANSRKRNRRGMFK